MLQDKIQALRNKYQLPEDNQQIEVWEQEAARLLLVASIVDTEAIQNLVKELQREVDDMDSVLVRANSKMLPPHERDVLLERKQLFLRVISYFIPNKRLKELEGEIDENLKRV